jgi:hypothetical protein
MRKKLIFISLLSIFLSACTIGGTNTARNDGGLFFSQNRGDTWQQRSLIPTSTGSPRSIAGLSANKIAMDPNDPRAIYFASVDNGLFYSYNAGADWQKAEGLGNVNVKYVAVDPESKCIIYAAVVNRVQQSTDCNRTWNNIYYDNSPAVMINTIVIDHYNPKIIYIGTSRGEIIKSIDRGASWKTIVRFDSAINEIALSPHDSRIILASTNRHGVHKSFNGGDSFISLENQLKEYRVRDGFTNLIFSPSTSGLIFMANGYGMIKSENNGDTWSPIQLITPDKKTDINSMIVSPQDPQIIYYVTNTTFYRSTDGGATWSTKKLPTTKAGWGLLADPNNAGIIYLSTMSLSK